MRKMLRQWQRFLSAFVPSLVCLLLASIALKPASARRRTTTTEAEEEEVVEEMRQRHISGPIQRRDHVQALMSTLFDDYDKRIRPYSDTEEPVVVEMTIVLAILTELRENQQVASFVISHLQKWTDPGLRWNPDDFGGLRQMIVPQSMVWVPKLFVYNSMDTKEMLSKNRFDIRITHTGRIKLNIPQYVTCICRLHIEHFPFDTQFCAIAQASPLLNVSEMDVNATQPPKDSYFSGNAEWEVTNVTVRHMRFLEDGEYRPEVHFIVHLHRRPIYYITVIVAPTFLISALSILGIFSPNSSDGPRNEKVSLGLGSLLAMSVLLDIVSAAMPKSNSIPLLGYYIVSTILLCAIGVGINMALLAICRQLIQSNQLPSERTYRLLCMKPKSKEKGFWKLGDLDYCATTPTAGSCSSKFAAYVHCAAASVTPSTTVTTATSSDNHKSPTPAAAATANGSAELPNGSAAPLSSSSSFVRIPGFMAIYSRVREIADAQTALREKLERRKWHSLVRKEWNRVFNRFDYFFLFLFSAMNVGALLFFLQFSWMPIPDLPDDFLI